VRINILEGGVFKRHPYIKRLWLRDRFFRPCWFPVQNAFRELRDLGIEVRFYTGLNRGLWDCDAVILSSRTVEDLALSRRHEFSSRAEFCAWALNRQKRLIWFDTRDSAGNCQFDVVPYVERYLKKQLYRDRRTYLKRLHRGRAYADYYHRHHSGNVPVDDGAAADRFLPETDTVFVETEVAKSVGETNKLYAAWGCGAEFHWPLLSRTSAPGYILRALAQYAMGVSMLRPRTVPVDSYRPVAINALFDARRFKVRSVGYQRLLGLHAARQLKLEPKLTGRVPRYDFYKTLAQSKVTISTFGWGEVCFREYEATYCGSAILMADMSNIETYPDLYRPEFYMPFKWDFSDFEERATDLLSDDERRLSMARAAQAMLMRQWSTPGREAFAHRFRDLVTPHRVTATALSD